MYLIYIYIYIYIYILAWTCPLNGHIENMENMESRKYGNFENFGNFEVWSYEIHVVLKMISVAFLKVDFGSSKFGIYSNILEISFGGPIASYSSLISSYGSRLIRRKLFSRCSLVPRV